MDFYAVKLDTTASKKVVVSDMILTKDIPTTAGSKMLDGYKSLFEAEVLTRLSKGGYGLIGKAKVGEFAIDLLGETCYTGITEVNGNVVDASAEIVKMGEADVAVCLDVNGNVLRAGARDGLISFKPTYGAVSRYGVIPVACSGETVSVIAKTAKDCQDALKTIVGHDDKDGTSLPNEVLEKITGENGSAPARVALLKSMKKGASQEVLQKLDAFVKVLEKNGISVIEIDDEVISTSNVCWNVLMSAELCNNVSRYDGVKYGYRSQNFTNIDELYTNSRTESFGDLLKKAIIFGSETLSTENYMKVYDKCLRMRRVIVEAFNKLFTEYGAVLMPVCSKLNYSVEEVKNNKDIAFVENFYTAPASITGLPSCVLGGVQLVGKALSDNDLLAIAKIYEKECE